MKKIDPTVRKETGYIALVTFLAGILQQAVFMILGKWSISVLLGGIYGWAVALGNFFCMCLSVQKAVSQEEKDAKNTIRLSQSLRLWAMFFLALAAYFIPLINTVAAVIPYLFPRLAIALIPAFRK